MARTLVIGDVHGCARALERLLRDARPDRVLLVGDLLPKGPEPRRTWEVIRDCGALAVMGNHDARLLEVWGRRGDGVHHATWPQLDEGCRDWLAALPLVHEEDDWLVIHAGVHPTEGLVGTTRKMALTLRRWPDDSDLSHPFWWERYAGPTRVYYGHDAMRGVQIHRYSVGLDAGCVYGGWLVGVVVETGERYAANREGEPGPDDAGVLDTPRS